VYSDDRLARLASRGNADAFAALYERHHHALSRYCRAILHDEEDAQDALQSAMMRAYAALQSRQRDLKVRPWLFRIVHNEAISILRRRPQTGLARLGGLLEHVDGLARTVLARLRQPLSYGVPEFGHGALVADHHPRVAGGGDLCERIAAAA